MKIRSKQSFKTIEKMVEIEHLSTQLTEKGVKALHCLCCAVVQNILVEWIVKLCHRHKHRQLKFSHFNCIYRLCSDPLLCFLLAFIGK